MEFTEYGTPAGKPVVYFHGVPGSPYESAILEAPARELGLRVLCFDRFAIDRSTTGTDYYRQIAQSIDETVQGAPVDFIAFSLGAHVALEVSALMSGQVARLHLVAAAAPLDAGDFVDEMAGKAVFSLARHSPILFRWLARWQALLARRAPHMLFRMLFASARGQDEALVQSPDFSVFIQRVLRRGFAWASPATHGMFGSTCNPGQPISSPARELCSCGTALRTTGRPSAWRNTWPSAFRKGHRSNAWMGCPTIPACTPRHRESVRNSPTSDAAANEQPVLWPSDEQCRSYDRHCLLAGGWPGPPSSWPARLDHVLDNPARYSVVVIPA